jgi:hypothetical protein
VLDTKCSAQCYVENCSNAVVRIVPLSFVRAIHTPVLSLKKKHRVNSTLILPSSDVK